MCEIDGPYLPTADDWQEAFDANPIEPIDYAMMLGGLLDKSDAPMPIDGDAMTDAMYGDEKTAVLQLCILEGAILGAIKGWWDFCTDDNPMASTLDDRPRMIWWRDAKAFHRAQELY